MAKNFNSFLEELKDKCDIVEVMGKYITLTQKGRNFWGRCPFHNEKTPSLAVNQEDRYYHCFGCNASGDVIKFVQEMESLDFIDSIKYLSGQYGLQMPDDAYSDKESGEAKKQRDRLYGLLKESAKYYHSCLKTHGAEVIQYLEKRGITEESRARFGIGYAKDYNGLLTHLNKLGFTEQEMISAAVAVKKDGRSYDPLGGRLIVPIINSMGDVVAFGGRAMDKTSYAKYKNSSESALFNKSKNLYSINLVKKQKQEKGIDSIIVVEGYMDAISLYQAGFKNCVASMGTALTKEQARLIKRFTADVIICYDGDAAGQTATMRGLDILREEGLNVRVISLPDGEDPDDYIRSHGNDAFSALIRDALPLPDFKLTSLAKSFDIESSDGRRKYTKQALTVIAKESDPSVREELLKSVRTVTGITYESLHREMEQLRHGDAASAGEKDNAPQALPDGAEVKALRFILYCLLKGYEFAVNYQRIERFITENIHMQVYSYVQNCKKEGNAPRPSAMFEIAAEQDFPEVSAILESGSNMDKQKLERYYNDCLIIFVKEGYDRRLKLLAAEFEQETDIDKRNKIALEIQVLTMEQKRK